MSISFISLLKNPNEKEKLWSTVRLIESFFPSIFSNESQLFVDNKIEIRNRKNRAESLQYETLLQVMLSLVLSKMKTLKLWLILLVDLTFLLEISRCSII